jgi:dTMP kinase
MPSLVLAGFVTFEGIDGSGKTTVSRLAADRLRSQGHAVYLTSEPTKGWLGEAVRRGIAEDVGAVAEALLFLADRAAHIPDIQSHLAKDELVLCDRYADSTYAYQGARLAGIVRDPLRFLQRASEDWVLLPDLTVLLKVPPDVAIARIKDRPDRMRFEDLNLLTKVAANYDRLAKSRRFVIVDASRSVDHAVDDAVSAIESRLPTRRGA